jgi:hypothetical protein
MSSDLDTFIQAVSTLYDAASKYSSSGDPNDLVLQWLRHVEYNSTGFQFLIGFIDNGWIAQVNSQGLTVPATFTDPFYGPITQRTSHLGAAMHAAYKMGLPGDGTSADSLSKINGTDMAGWGGDLIQFYAEWLHVILAYPDPAVYATDMLFSQSSAYYKMEDLLEDVDGFLIGVYLKNNPTVHIADALTTYYKATDNHTGYRSRLRDFWKARFATVQAANRAPSLVYGMLFGLGADTSGLWPWPWYATKMIYGAQQVLQTFYGPNQFGEVDIPYVDSKTSARFCQSFLNVYNDVMNQEAATFP